MKSPLAKSSGRFFSLIIVLVASARSKTSEGCGQTIANITTASLVLYFRFVSFTTRSQLSTQSPTNYVLGAIIKFLESLNIPFRVLLSALIIIEHLRLRTARRRCTRTRIANLIPSSYCIGFDSVSILEIDVGSC